VAVLANSAVCFLEEQNIEIPVSDSLRPIARSGLEDSCVCEKEAQLIQPQSLDVILGEYSEMLQVWAIQGKSGKYLVIPDNRFPGRKPVRFFKSQYDAHRMMDTILKVSPALELQRLAVVDVLLLAAIRKVAADKTPPHADSFVISSSDEVYELISQIKTRSIPK